MQENTDRLAIHIMILCTLFIAVTSKWWLIPKIKSFMRGGHAEAEIVFVDKEKNDVE